MMAHRVALNTATSAATSAALRAAIFSRLACDDVVPAMLSSSLLRLQAVSSPYLNAWHVTWLPNMRSTAACFCPATQRARQTEAP